MGACLLALCASSARAETPPHASASRPSASAPTLSSASTPQAIYDQAQAAYDTAQWKLAADKFVQLLPHDRARPLKRFEAVIAYRYADSLLHLDREGEAAVWLDRALPPLAADKDKAVYAEAIYVKATLQRATYDFDAAIRSYDQANQLLTPADPLDLRYRIGVGLAYAGVTVDPKHVLDQLERLATDPAFASAQPVDREQIDDLQARAAMNLGDLTAARRFIDKALKDGGGLTEAHVTLGQVATRADAALIAHLGKRLEDEREYLTYTGAGHLEDPAWIGEQVGDLPTCGDTSDGAQPQDFAIVKFTIAADGGVMNALPVYTNRPGRLGAIFARAAGQWRWDPVVIAKVDPFWRSTLQLELRCAKRPDPRQLPLLDNAQQLAQAEQDAGFTPAEAAFLAKGGSLTLSADDPRLSGPRGGELTALAGPLPRSTAAMETLWTRLEREKPPASAYAALILRWATQRSAYGFSTQNQARAKANALAEWLPRMRASFPDSPSTDQLVMAQAWALEEAGDFAAAEPLLESLVDLPPERQAKSPTLRPLALLHRAIALDHLGQSDAARRSLEKSGLDGSQCALFDTRPLPKSQAVGENVFPEAALRWQFQGYVKTDFDIANDGRVKDARSVIAYPPFVFEDATDKTVSGFTYVPPRLGGQAVGCEGQSRVFNFRVRS